MWFSECTYEHMCCAFKNFFVRESIVHTSRSILDPQKGRCTSEVVFSFPHCLLSMAHTPENGDGRMTVTTGALGVYVLLCF